MQLESGRYLIKKVREAISSYLSGKSLPDLEGFQEKQGVFVTLHTYPENQLRGCIGFAQPVLPLHDALVRAAIGAAVHDPRFSPVSINELDKLVIEISVLSPPQKMVCPAGQRPGQVSIGKDGLIAACGNNSGLLLPQVAVDLAWDSKTFLCQTCVKAGLPKDSWEKEDVEFHKFQAEIFSEKTPKGEIEKKKII